MDTETTAEPEAYLVTATIPSASYGGIKQAIAEAGGTVHSAGIEAEQGKTYKLGPARPTLDELIAPPTLDRIHKALGTLRALVPEELPEAMGAEAMRDELAREITYALHAAGEYRELDVLENAKAIRDLTEAYVRLGGDVALAFGPEAAEPEPEPRINPADAELVERLVNTAWQGATHAGASTAIADTVANYLRAELDKAAGR